MNRVWGIHVVERILQDSPEQVVLLKVAKDNKRVKGLLELAKDLGATTEVVDVAELDQLCGGGNHQGVVLQVIQAVLPTSLEEIVEQQEGRGFYLLLDGVQDPHNLGACLRSANVAGATAVIIPKDRAVGLTPVVRKVACGAAEITPLITVTNLVRSMKWLQEQGVWIYGASEHASDSLYDLELTGSIGMVLGSEGKGMRRLTEESCDGLFAIPTVGEIKTLNVSVATGVCLFEVVRQRLG